MPIKSLKNKSVTKKIMKDKSKKEKKDSKEKKDKSKKKDNKNKKEKKENNKKENNKKENKLKNDILHKLEHKKRTLDILKTLIFKKIQNMHQKKLYLQNHSIMKNNSCPRKIFIIKK